MSTRLALIFVVAGGLAGALPADAQDDNQAAAPPEMPPPRAIPGITIEDQFPGGCVDCHINYVDMNMDTRLSTFMSRWRQQVDPVVLQAAQSVASPEVTLTGKHPEIDAGLDDIPAVCLDCHQSGPGSRVPLPPLLHKLHLGDGADGVFLRIFQGECTHCHKLDQNTGQWRIPSGAER